MERPALFVGDAEEGAATLKESEVSVTCIHSREIKLRAAVVHVIYMYIYIDYTE